MSIVNKRIEDFQYISSIHILQDVNYVFSIYVNLGLLEQAIDLSQKHNLTKNIELFYNACNYGHLDMVRFIDSFGGYDIDSYTYAFYIALSKNNIHICQWLLSTYPDINISKYSSEIYKDLFFFGFYDAILYYDSLEPNYDINYHKEFKNICLGNHLKIAQWVYQKCEYLSYPYYESILSDIFNEVCTRDYLEMAQWLYSVFPSQIDLSENNKSVMVEIFQECCGNGHLKTAQWIYSFIHPMIKPYDYTQSFEYSSNGEKFTYYVEIESALDIAVFNNQLSIIQWLFSLYDLKYKLKSILNTVYEYQKDYLEIFKWIMNVYYSEDITILRKSLLTSCGNGSNKITKYILREYKSKLTLDILDKSYVQILSFMNNEILLNSLSFYMDINLLNIFSDYYPERYSYEMYEFHRKMYYKPIIKYRLQEKRIEEIRECDICLEEKSNIITLCNHQFCNNCLKDWLDNNVSCPMCRKKVSYSLYNYKDYHFMPETLFKITVQDI